MSTLRFENWVKNIILIMILIPSYLDIQKALVNSSIVADKASIGSLLVAVSILSVTACFGNFSFTYADVSNRTKSSRLLAHFTTGLLMLLIGLSLEMTSVLTKLLVGDFLIFDISLAILYIASVLYDFWDLRR